MKNDFIHSLGLVGYTARIRRLNDKLMSMGKEVYKNLNLEIEPNWHLILLLLENEKELSATEIANHLSFTHTAIIKIAKKMVQKEYLKSYKSKTDSRKQMYTLSNKAILELPKLKEVLEMIAEVHKQYVNDQFLLELDHIETSLSEKDTISRVNELRNKWIKINNDISLESLSIEYHKKLRGLMKVIYPPAYAHLWTDSGKNYLSKVYSEENLKRELSDNKAPYYFINYCNKTVGIIRFIINTDRRNKSEYKSVKLDRIYLNKSTQGKGIGTILINWVQQKYAGKFEEIWLEVMDTQKTAIMFYEKLGFSIVGKTQIQSDFIKTKYKGMYIMNKKINHEEKV